MLQDADPASDLQAYGVRTGLQDRAAGERVALLRLGVGLDVAVAAMECFVVLCILGCEHIVRVDLERGTGRFLDCAVGDPHTQGRDAYTA